MKPLPQNTKMIFSSTPEFTKELKSFTKRWPSLPKDLNVVKQVIETLYVDQDGVDRVALRKNFFNSKRATILSQTEHCEAVKMRMNCASLGGKDSVRLVFVYVYDGNSVVFIELFSKTNKARENIPRLQKFLCERTTKRDG